MKGNDQSCLIQSRPSYKTKGATDDSNKAGGLIKFPEIIGPVLQGKKYKALKGSSTLDR
jgi:hypothetical protein